MTATVPLWAAIVIAVGSPLLAFDGVLLGQVLTRRSAHETETRWQREETMWLLRWGTDHAIASDARSTRLGTASLEALGRSPLLQGSDQDLIGAVLDEAVTGWARDRVDVRTEER